MTLFCIYPYSPIVPSNIFIFLDKYLFCLVFTESLSEPPDFHMDTGHKHSACLCIFLWTHIHINPGLVFQGPLFYKIIISDDIWSAVVRENFSVLSNSQGGCAVRSVCLRADLRSASCAVSTLTSVSSRTKNLFSTVMFVFALHAQNM